MMPQTTAVLPMRTTALPRQFVSEEVVIAMGRKVEGVRPEGLIGGDDSRCERRYRSGAIAAMMLAGNCCPGGCFDRFAWNALPAGGFGTTDGMMELMIMPDLYPISTVVYKSHNVLRVSDICPVDHPGPYSSMRKYIDGPGTIFVTR